MPQRSVWLVRVALINLVAGFTIGGLLLVHKAIPLHPAFWTLRALHIEMLVFGFMVQLAFGVALWILPRAPHAQAEAPALWAGALLNLGVWFVGLGGALQLGAPTLVGRLVEAGALATFAVQVWPRIRSFRRQHQKSGS